MKIKEVFSLNFVNSELYDEILDIVYNILDFDFSYKKIEDLEDLEDLKNKKYNVCVHYKDLRYLILFCDLRGQQKTILISKNEIKKQRKSVKLSELKMFYLDYNFKKKYTNTILDGKLISKGKTNEFVIFDINSKKFNRIKIADKIKVLEEDNFMEDINKNFNKFSFKITKYYTYDQIEDLVFNKIINASTKISGLVFLPEYSGKYYVYINEPFFNVLQKGKIPKRTKHYDSSEVTFIMEKTPKRDVYFLYDIDTKEKINTIAHIPDIMTSVYYREIFENNTRIETTCIKSEKYNMWIPLCDDRISYDSVLI